MENVFTVLWTNTNGEGCSETFTQKEEANCFYLQLLSANVEGLMAVRPDGTVVMPKKTAKKAYVIKAVFKGYNKVYSYPSKAPAKEGETIVVHSPNGYGFPTVISCEVVEESALPELCNLKPNNLNWVIGVLNKF